MTAVHRVLLGNDDCCPLDYEGFCRGVLWESKTYSITGKVITRGTEAFTQADRPKITIGYLGVK